MADVGNFEIIHEIREQGRLLTQEAEAEAVSSELKWARTIAKASILIVLLEGVNSPAFKQFVEDDLGARMPRKGASPVGPIFTDWLPTPTTGTEIKNTRSKVTQRSHAAQHILNMFAPSDTAGDLIEVDRPLVPTDEEKIAEYINKSGGFRKFEPAEMKKIAKLYLTEWHAIEDEFYIPSDDRILRMLAYQEFAGEASAGDVANVSADLSAQFRNGLEPLYRDREPGRLNRGLCMAVLRKARDGTVSVVGWQEEDAVNDWLKEYGIKTIKDSRYLDREASQEAKKKIYRFTHGIGERIRQFENYINDEEQRIHDELFVELEERGEF